MSTFFFFRMNAGILGLKQGMSRIANTEGVLVPVTIIKVTEHQILEVRNSDKHVKNAVVLGSNAFHNPTKNRKFKNIKQFEVSNLESFEKGKNVTIEILKDVKEVSVSSTSTGKGFQGVMKRHGFHGGPGSHGSHFHREPGSIGQRAAPGKVMKGKKLAGHMGMNRITLKKRPVVAVDIKNSLVMIKGAVPGVKNTVVELRF